jgi:AcrR family transcriptional regulator
MPKVTEAHLEARRQQILDAAWTCFARKGYHQTTMQDMCEESELSPGAIYRYFEGKESILRATYDRYQQMARAVVDEARSQAAGPLDTLQVIGQTMWLSYFNDPMFETTTRVQIDTWPEIIRDEALLESSREDLTFWRTVVTQLLTEAKNVGQVKADVDPASLASLMICAHEGLRHFRLVDPDSFEPERVLEAILTLVSAKTPVEPPRKRRSKASVRRK